MHNGYLASAGSDRQVAVWHLETNKLVNVLCDHEDSVLCVRFDDKRLVSCSKGESGFFKIEQFTFLTPKFFLLLIGSYSTNVFIPGP